MNRQYARAGEVACKAQVSGSVQGIFGKYSHISNGLTKIHGGAITFQNGIMYVTINKAMSEKVPQVAVGSMGI